MHLGISFCALVSLATFSYPSWTIPGRTPRVIRTRSTALYDLSTLASRDPEFFDTNLDSKFGTFRRRADMFSGNTLVRRGCASSKNCQTGSSGNRPPAQRPGQPQQQQQSPSPPSLQRSNSLGSGPSHGNSPSPGPPTLRRTSSSSSSSFGRSSVGDGSVTGTVSMRHVDFDALARGSPSWDQRVIRAGSSRPPRAPRPPVAPITSASSRDKQYDSGQTDHSGAVSLPSQPGTPRSS